MKFNKLVCFALKHILKYSTNKNQPFTTIIERPQKVGLYLQNK